MQPAIAVLTKTDSRLDAIEDQMRKIPEYGPRLEMSRGFPSKPDELKTIGIKLEAAEDLQRLKEFGLPTSTFLEEKLPDKKVKRVNDCFTKLLKKRPIDLYHKDPAENMIFLLYHQGAWRIAYFEDDRELMEEVFADPAMKETIKRHFGKHQATVSPFMRPRGATGSSSSNSSVAGDGGETGANP